MKMLYRLKILRNEQGHTQSDIAKYLNIGQNTYSQYETAKRELPIEALIKLSALYDVSTDYILGLTDEDTPYPKSAD